MRAACGATSVAARRRVCAIQNGVLYSISAAHGRCPFVANNNGVTATMNISIRAGLIGLLAAPPRGLRQERRSAADAGGRARRRVAAAGEEKVVNVYNWSDYIDPTMLEKFTAETGIKVNYDVFDSNEVLETKLLAGNTGYDVVVPSASFLERQIKAGVFRKLDRSKLPNWATSTPRSCSASRCTTRATSTRSTTCGARTASATTRTRSRRSTPNAPVDSWDIVFDPKLAAKFKDCGISVLDAPSEIVAVDAGLSGQGPEQPDRGGPQAGRRQADGDPPLHPHDPQLAVHRRARQRRDLPRASAGAATSCRRATAPPKPDRAT